MIYNDGYEVDGNLRFVKCPRCGNEQYSDNAKYCRICGFYVYNECEGDFEPNEYGNNGEYRIHKNAGNARFCEYCGKPTMLFKEKLLKAYTEVQEEQPDPVDEEIPYEPEDEDEGLPFDTDDTLPFY